MSWRLIKSVQQHADLRIILPFGLNVKIGSIVGMSPDGGFSLEGNCRTILGLSATPGSTGSPSDLLYQGGRETSFKFRAAGDGSALFPNLPAASAGFDIELGSSGSWILASTKRTITAMEDENRFRRPILDAYQRGVWQPHWAMVTQIGQVQNLTFLAATSANTKVALSVDSSIDAGAAAEVKLTANASITASNRELIQCIYREPSVAFCRAVRVRDPWYAWFSPPTIGVLGSTTTTDAPKGDIDKAEYDEFFEDADDLYFDTPKE